MASGELQLVNQVDLKLALAESDSAFEKSLNNFLPPLLLKLASPHAEVRNAVFKTIQNIFPRITAARELQLPVDALLNQAKEPNVPSGSDSSSVRLYSLLFVSKGVDRLDDGAKSLLVPKVIEGISEKSPAVSARLFSLLVKLLNSWKAPERGTPEYDDMSSTLGFMQRRRDETYLARKIAQFYLLVPMPNPPPTPIPLPGLSASDVSFFTKDAGVSYKTAQELSSVKANLLEFMRSGFSDQALALPLLIASCDTLSAISELAYTRFRKLDYNFTDDGLMDTLIDLFVGKQDSHPPVNSMLQERILSVLLKCDGISSSPKVKEMSKIGLSSDYPKLRQTAVVFIKKVTSSMDAPTSDTREYNSEIAFKLKESIVADGWPQMDSSLITNYRSALSSRELNYEALGDLLKNSPSLWADDLTYIEFFFQSLENESTELRPAIQSVLSKLTVHLPSISSESKNRLKSLLKKCLLSGITDKNTSACKHIAIKFVNCAYPFDDADARLLCLLGTAKENNIETIEDAKKGLHPFHFNLLQSSNSTDFKSSEEYLGKSSQVSYPTFENMVSVLRNALSEDNTESVVKSCLGEAFNFILSMLVMNAIDGQSTVVAVDENWDQRLEKGLEMDEKVRSLVEQKIDSMSADVAMDQEEPSAYAKFLDMVFSAFEGQFFEGLALRSDNSFGRIFNLLVTMSPATVIRDLAVLIPRLLRILKDAPLDKDSLSNACKCLGIIGTHQVIESPAVMEFVDELKGIGGEARILGTAYIYSRMALRRRIDTSDTSLLDDYLNALIPAFKESKYFDVCLEAVTQLSIFGALGPELSLSTNAEHFRNQIAEIITPKAKALHERSVICLACLSLSFPSTYEDSGSESAAVEKIVYDIHNAKQIDQVFSSGDAMSILAGGWSSKYLRLFADIRGESVTYVPSETGRLSNLLQMVLHSTSQTKPSLRRASCIWLLSLVQYLGHMPLVREKSVEIHYAFMKFLGDREDLIQESAARGLSIVYELGNADLKETLVKGLLRSFTDSNASASLSSGTVDLETQLFEKDTLRTHDSSVSTYRDVLNLASDVGDPSLVYKFMSLAKSNALWSSRRGMAFGLESILSKSSLDDMLYNNKSMRERLIPRLFCYRFDPNYAVSSSMNDIWSALITDSSKAVAENFSIILSYVLKSMGDREWRSRQAGCVALNNLLQTQSLDVYEHHIDDICNMSFRAMDDIKESVRKEGQTLAKTLSRILIRTADPSSGNVSSAKASEVIQKLIPLFMGNKGLLGDSEDVRSFSLETVLKICEVGGSSIKPHISNLLSTFIELMSTLEPEVVNYLVLNADKYNLDKNDIDAKRLQSIGHSPMMDAIDKILDLVDDEIIDDVVNSVKAASKKSVGLPSKVCGSRVIVGLISRRKVYSEKLGDSLLDTCIRQLRDRNSAVSQSFAVAAGHCCRIASFKAVVDYSKRIESLYLDAEDSKDRKVAAVASEAVSKYCGADKFERFASAFLPMAYIGKHDSEPGVSAVFEKEWIESSSGVGAVKLYYPEIAELCEANVKSNNYNVRQIMARTISDVCDTVKMLSEKELKELFAILLDACQGKSWDGKELVFNALVKLSVENKDFLQSSADIQQSVLKTVSVEQKRRNKSYQSQVVFDVSKFLRSFPKNEDVTTSFISILGEILSDEYFEEIESTPSTEQVKSLKSGKSVAIEEYYLKYLRCVVEALSAELVNDELLNFAYDSMRSFSSSSHTLSWRTCFALNENFKHILDVFESTQANDAELTSLAEAYKTLLSFGEMYRLEKCAVIFARNSKSVLSLFRKHHESAQVEYVEIRLKEMLQDNVSSVQLSTTSQSENQVKSRLLSDVVVGQGSAVFQLLTGEDQSLSVWWDTLLVLDLGLDVVDGVRGLNLKGNGLTGQGLDEDLHTTSQSENQVKSRLLSDVVVGQSSAVFQLLTSENQSLSVWRNTFLVLDLGLNVVNGVGGFNFECDGLAGQSLDKDLHTTSQSKDQVKGGFLLNVVVRQGSAILQLLTGEDQSLSVWWNTLLVLDLGLDVVNGVRRFDFKSNGLTGQGLDEDLHTTSQSKDQVQSRLLSDVVVGQGSAVLQLLTGKDQSLSVWWDTLLVLDFRLDVVDSVRRLNLKGNGLTGQSLNKNLHTTSQSEDQVKGGFLLDVVVRQGSAVFQLLTSEN